MPLVPGEKFIASPGRPRAVKPLQQRREPLEEDVSMLHVYGIVPVKNFCIQVQERVHPTRPLARRPVAYATFQPTLATAPYWRRRAGFT